MRADDRGSHPSPDDQLIAAYDEFGGTIRPCGCWEPGQLSDDWFTPEESLNISLLDIRTAPIYKLRGAQGDLLHQLRHTEGDDTATDAIWVKLHAIQEELDDREFTSEVEVEMETSPRTKIEPPT